MTLVILPPGKLKYFLLTIFHFMIADTSYPEVRRRAFLTEGKRKVKVHKTLLCQKKMEIVKEGLKGSPYNSEMLKISVICTELLYSPDTRRQYMILLSFSTRDRV